MNKKVPCTRRRLDGSWYRGLFANALSLRLCRYNLAAPARLERATYCLGGSRSIHLGYGVVLKSGFIITQALQSRKK